MTHRSSRTYKLRLSEKGVDFFLSCHCRLAHLVQDFIPYGMTLHVAVLLLCQAGLSDLLADLSERECKSLAGGITHYVGTSHAVNAITAALVDQLERSGEIASAPPVRMLYILALLALRDASDEDVLAAFMQAAQPELQAS
jgi:hypothetical protein